MEMIIILIVSVILATMPILIAAFFRAFTLPRKLMVVQEEVKRVAPGHPVAAEFSSAMAITESDPHIQALVARYFSSSTLLLPALLLTLFYLAGFALCV